MNDNILPKGFYTVESDVVTIKKGPYKGVKFRQEGKIKIFEDVLTGVPQLCYDYRILEYNGYDPSEIETSPKLCRIIATILVEQFNKFLESDDSEIEGIECPNELKHSC